MSDSSLDDCLPFSFRSRPPSAQKFTKPSPPQPSLSFPLFHDDDDDDEDDGLFYDPSFDTMMGNDDEDDSSVGLGFPATESTNVTIPKTDASKMAQRTGSFCSSSSSAKIRLIQRQLSVEIDSNEDEDDKI
jgi:hypothetical protein